ncbi:MAG: enoyl-CoA hydratase/isomerase family protein, partial [Candidatus Eremiobacteraeota bacterium]|nr:enoyl-CoA hydratase/isomerase family protein [Candidatus Eremiobacteraeota bacterium]
MQTCDDVRTSRDGTVGRITLDRPAKLNALTLEMVRAMSAALGNWRDDPGISLVVIDGAGERGFCAGGDLRVLYDAARAGNGRAQAFWTEQYRLDATIARYGKPVVAFMSGTV